MKRIYLNLIFLVLTTQSVKSQDAVFTNAHQSLVLLNPSFAGSNGNIRNQISYRNQWPNLSGTYITYANSFDMFMTKINGGLAINVIRDDISRGTLRTDIVNVTYAQYFYSGNKKLKIIPSIQAGFFQHTLDLGRVSFGNYYPNIGNGSTNSISSSKTNFDLSAGLLAQYEKFFSGHLCFISHNLMKALRV